MTCATYRPYGEEHAAQATVNHYKFTGKERDAESGLDYFGARYYASTAGRFLSVDPTGLSVTMTDPQTWNRYSYVNNRPLNYIDPNGKWTTGVHNWIIEQAFDKLLSGADRDVLKGASASVDKWQAPEHAYAHAMSAAYLFASEMNENPADAANRSGEFIAANLDDAVREQIKHELAGGQGNSRYALELFGVSLHTVTDAKSPQHAGWQPWYGRGDGSSGYVSRSFSHGVREVVNGVSSEEAKHAAVVAARFHWLRYQEELRRQRAARQRIVSVVNGFLRAGGVVF